ncbi:S8 family serine peptidase [Candidatus Falkowbacteria bacterium]|nr:S8 family serine peptidase [Candidatus Falkowbacteria bacterium]
MKGLKIFAVLFLCNFIIFSTVSAADTYYPKQWYLDKIKAPEAWTITKGDSSIIVAVVDTGVDLNHPDLKDNIWTNGDEKASDGIDNDINGYIDDVSGWDFIDNDNDPTPAWNGNYSVNAINHGTFLAGIISAIHDNNQGIKGVTANVKIMALRAMDDSGFGTSANVAKAINYAVNNGANVVNLSFGGSEYSATLKDSIRNAFEHNVLVVAAAGNAENGQTKGKDLTSNPMYPICYDREFPQNTVLGVLASTKENKVADFTNYGKDCTDIAAPGVDIVSTIFQDSSYQQFNTYYQEAWSGSSFSAAMVSGAAALLKSVDKSLTAGKIIKTLLDESGLLFVGAGLADRTAAGILNIKKALDKIAGIASSAPTTGTPAVAPSASAIKTVSNGADIIVSVKNSGSGKFKIFNSLFKQKNEIEVFKGADFVGLNLSMANVNNDNEKDIVAGAARGSPPFVRVVDAWGKLLVSFFAFDKNFKGGVEVAAGDIDADGKVEIIVAPESGYAPVVEIFDLDGNLKKEFFAYNQDFKNGINLAVGDVDKDGMLEIITAPHKGLFPKIKIFNWKGELKKSFLAYSPQFEGGVNISVADVDNNGQLDIITGAGVGGGPHVKAFNYEVQQLVSFMAYNEKFTGGVEVFGIDWNKDGKTDIVTGAGAGGGPHVKIFDKNASLLGEFFAYDAGFTKGINIVGR